MLKKGDNEKAEAVIAPANTNYMAA